MTAPASPSPSSTDSSSFSDSETSHSSYDSGIDSLAGGSLHPEYMDLDEFLIATSAKQLNQLSNSLTSSAFSQIQPNRTSIQYQSTPTLNTGKEDACRNSDTKSEQNKTFAIEKSTRKTVQNNPRNQDNEDHGFKYNPLPMKKIAKRKFVSDEAKDEQYWKRRNRNNEAARRSRDMRRQREIEVSSQWQQLEKENARLKKELKLLKERASELERQLLEKQK